MEWTMRIPSAALADLLNNPVGELSEVEVAVRTAIENIYTPEQIEALKGATHLDSILPVKEERAVATVRKV